MKKQKRTITLLEIMIVILLIGLIGSVIGYNMKGSLDEGKKFKTEEAIRQARDVLLLEVAKGTKAEVVAKKPKYYLKNSGLVKDPKILLKDGWGYPLKISVSNDGNDFDFVSQGLNEYYRKKRKKVPSEFSVKDDEY